VSRTPVGVRSAGGPFGGAPTTNPRDKRRGRASDRRGRTVLPISRPVR